MAAVHGVDRIVDTSSVSRDVEMTRKAAGERKIHWSRDELILALDVYIRLAGSVPDPRLREVRDLSNILRRAELHPASERRSDFRTPASVAMKLMNFRSIDPGYGGKGLAAGGRLDREVWQQFAGDGGQLSKVADAIRCALSANAAAHENREPLADLAIEAEEGAVLTRLHQIRERDPRLVRSKKRCAMSDLGQLYCEVCGFCFRLAYGEVGEGFIECHHRRPLCDLRPGQKTSLEDLALLCANCHRIIHGRRPWLTVEQLQVIVRGRGYGAGGSQR